MHREIFFNKKGWSGKTPFYLFFYVFIKTKLTNLLCTD